MRRTRIGMIALGAVGATLATTKGRRFLLRSVAAYLLPSIRFLPDDSDIASGSSPRPRG
jgi:hypothetical protein